MYNLTDSIDFIAQSFTIISIYLRVIVIIFLFFSLLYSIYKVIKIEETINRLIYLVMGIIAGSFILMLIQGDQNWAIPILTVGLLIVTLVYARSNQKYVELIETERKGKRIAEISRSIFSEMENLIDEIYPILNNGETIHSIRPFSSPLKEYSRPNRILKEIIPIKSDKIDVEFSSNQIVGYCRAESMLKSGDDILKKYLPKVQNLCDKYDQNVQRMEELIGIITQKILIETDEFKQICDEFDTFHTRFEDNDYYQILRYLLIPTQLIPESGTSAVLDLVSWQTFVSNYRPRLKEKLERSSINRELVEYFVQISEIKILLTQLNETIENLMKDWKCKYNLLESEIRVRKMNTI